MLHGVFWALIISAALALLTGAGIGLLLRAQTRGNPVKPSNVIPIDAYRSRTTAKSYRVR